MAGTNESRLATLAKIELDQTERIVLTEGALRRELIVCWVRLAAILSWAAAMSVVDIGRDVMDTTRIALGSSYLLWAIFMLRGVRLGLTQKTRDRRWLLTTDVWSIVVPIADVAFNCALFVVPSAGPMTALPALHPERPAVTFAMLIVLGIARKSWQHVAFAGALSWFGYQLTVYAPWWLYGVGPKPLMRGGTDLEMPISSVYITVAYALLVILVAQAQRLLREDFRRLRRLSNLKRFLPGPVAERIFEGGDEALKPVSREVTVMFTDIRNFTAQSEHMQPREVLEFLDDYFGHMSQIVKGRDGVVGKFIGDGMMAFWGVPEANPDHAAAALRAGLDMRKKLEELNATRIQEGRAPIHIGVGIHTGVVAAGLLGGAEAALSEYTVIGDAVNLASRIEGLNKNFGSDVLASEDTWLKAGSAFSGTRLGEEHVKGREHPVVIYRVDGYRT